MSSYPLEGLLRPKFEYYAAFVHALFAINCLIVPELFLLSSSIGQGFAALHLTRALIRFRQGRYVHRYQSNLWRWKPFILRRKNLPVSTKRIYLGEGFDWLPRHTQRLSDLDRQSFYGTVPKLYRRVRNLEVRFERTPILRTLVLVFSINSKFNPFSPARPPTGSSHLHALGSPEGYESQYLDDTQRTGHTAVLGTTGVGKTFLLRQMARQDVAAGHVVIAIDPKGDPEFLWALYEEAVAAGKAEQFHMMHLGFAEHSDAYNPIATFSRITEVASRVASQLPDAGQSRAFKEFVWRLVNVIARTMTALGRRIDYNDVTRYGQNIEPLAEEYLRSHLSRINHREGAWARDIEKDPAAKKEVNASHALARYYQKHSIADPLAESLIKILQYERSHFEKLTVGLLPLMDKLTTGPIAKLLSPDYADEESGRKIFNWPDIIRSGGIVYVGLDSLVDAEIAAAVGNSMFSDLTSTLGEIYKHGTGTDEAVKICIYADEFAEIVGPQFVQLLNKGRGAGLRVTVGAQTVEDLTVGFGDAAQAGQALGNINTIIMLRARNAATAELMTEQLVQAQVHSKMVISAANQTADPELGTHFTARNEARLTTERVDMLDPAHLAKLPPGEGFALVDGGRLVKVKFPMIETGVPGARNMKEVIERMRAYEEERRERVPSSRVPVNVVAAFEEEAA